MDGITTGGVTGSTAVDPRIATAIRGGPVAATAPVATPTPATASSEPQLAALAKAVAASAPVDTDRVEQIKTAIANGTFPILPATIADQMLSFRYEWMSDDPKSHD